MKFIPADILWLCVLLAAATVVLIWMLKFAPERLASIYQYRGFKEVIAFICKLTRLQPPVADVTSPAKVAHHPQAILKVDEYLLRSTDAFAEAGRKLKSIVRGHATQVDQIMQTLASCMLLRQKRTETTGLPPLATFLFVGSDGLGKRFLARKLANLLYRRQSIVEIDLATSSDGGMCVRVFGNESIDGLLIGVVRKNPHTMVIFQNIECASPDFIHVLEVLFSRGSLMDQKANGQISFQNCVFVLTTARCREELENARPRVEGKRNWHARAYEILSAETPLTTALLGSLNDLVLFKELRAIEKAEVISLLIRKECRRYNLKLEYVDPEILAEQVALVTNDVGFTTAPARISRLLHDPLVRASRDGLTSLVLRGNQITMVPDMDTYDR